MEWVDIKRAADPVDSVLLLIVFLLIGPTTVEGGGLSVKHLFTVQEAARGEYLSKPASIAADTLRGEVFVSDRGRNEILIYDEDGQFLQRFGSRQGFQAPFHLAVSSSGTLVAGEQDLPALSFLEPGEEQSTRIDLKLPNSNGILCGGISITPGGEILLVERFGREVVRVDRDKGSVERFFTGREATGGDPQFQDIIVTPDNRTVLISSRGSVVYILDEEGESLQRFGEHGSRPENFSFPTAAAIGPDGTFWIVDTFQHSIKVFQPNGSFYGEFGEMGTAEGQFFFPVDIAFGKEKRFFVLEKGIPRLQAFQLQNMDESENR